MASRLTPPCMLGLAAADALAPHAKARRLHLPAHDRDDLRLGQTGLDFNGVKADIIQPRHFDDFANVGVGHASPLLRGGSLCRAPLFALIALDIGLEEHPDTG